MSGRKIALGLFTAALFFFSAGIVGFLATMGVDRGIDDSIWIGLMFSAVNLAFGVSGYVITIRSGNPLGWLLLCLSVVLTLGGAADGYAAYGLYEDPGALPAASGAAWLADFVISGAGLLFGTFIFVFLLFPAGRLPSGRWRVVAYAGGAGALLAQLSVGLRPGPLPGFPRLDNPLGSTAARPLLDVAEPLGMLLILIGLIGAVASMVVRYRRSAPQQRQQMKWVGAAGGLLALIILSGPVWWFLAPSFGNVAWPALFAVGLAGIPISIAVSVLKYRLYEIDVVINKTLVYVSLTAVLAACYFGLIVLLQRVLPLSGDSDIAIAASTLAVAGLFQPLRTRLQAFIDRRFYRRKYDATETLGEFSNRLRDEVDLDSLTSELLGILVRTMQPKHASIWLRPASGDR